MELLFLFLLSLREASFHVGVGFRRNSRFRFRAGSTSLLPLVYVAVEAHFFLPPFFFFFFLGGRPTLEPYVPGP